MKKLLITRMLPLEFYIVDPKMSNILIEFYGDTHMVYISVSVYISAPAESLHNLISCLLFFFLLFGPDGPPPSQ